MAIKIISKPVKGIAAVIIIAVVLGSLSLIWSSWAGLIALAASIGGMVVFLGLWIEKEADEEEKKEHLSNFLGDKWRTKLKSEIGWWVLMIGIFIEVVTAGGFAAKDAVENKQIKINAAKNNPLNKPFFEASATVEIKVGENRFFTPSLDKPRPIENWQVLQASLILSSLNTNILLNNIPLSASSNDIHPEIMGNVSVSNSVEISRESNFGYKLKFFYEEYPDFRKSFNRSFGESKWPTAGQVLANFNVLRITENFIPAGAEVFGGSVGIVINNIHTNFEILPQQLKASINNGETFIIQTNMLP